MLVISGTCYESSTYDHRVWATGFPVRSAKYLVVVVIFVIATN
jgi:hypothetical protein